MLAFFNMKLMMSDDVRVLDQARERSLQWSGKVEWKSGGCLCEQSLKSNPPVAILGDDLFILSEGKMLIHVLSLSGSKDCPSRKFKRREVKTTTSHKSMFVYVQRLWVRGKQSMGYAFRSTACAVQVSAHLPSSPLQGWSVSHIWLLSLLSELAESSLYGCLCRSPACREPYSSFPIPATYPVHSISILSPYCQLIIYLINFINGFKTNCDFSTCRLSPQKSQSDLKSGDKHIL